MEDWVREDALTRLNRATYEAWAGEYQPDTSTKTDQIRRNIRRGLQRLAINISKLNSIHTEKQTEILKYESWRCLYCNHINGFQKTAMRVRRTCKECSRDRSNKLTCIQEIQAMKDCELTGIDYLDYLAEVNNTNEK